MKKVKGRDLQDLIRNINTWLDDGRTIERLILNVNDSKAESHELLIREIPREIKIKEIEKIKTITNTEIKYINAGKAKSNVENLIELRELLDLKADDFARSLGFTSLSGLRDLHIRTYPTKRKYALKISELWGLEVDHAFDLVDKPLNWVRHG